MTQNQAIKKIAKNFVKNIPQRIDKIRTSMEDGNREDLVSVAHELKGTAANFGYQDISKIASLLEIQGRQASQEQILRYLRDIEKLIIDAELEFSNFSL